MSRPSAVTTLMVVIWAVVAISLHRTVWAQPFELWASLGSLGSARPRCVAAAQRPHNTGFRGDPGSYRGPWSAWSAESPPPPSWGAFGGIPTSNGNLWRRAHLDSGGNVYWGPPQPMVDQPVLVASRGPDPNHGQTWTEDRPKTRSSISEGLRIFGMAILLMPLFWCGCLMLIVCRTMFQRYVQSVQRVHAGRAVPLVRYPGGHDRHPAPDDGLRSPHVPPIIQDLEYAVVPAHRFSAERLESQQPAPAQPPIGPPIRSLASPPRRRPPSPTVLNETCMICLEDFAPNALVKLLPCKHGFHEACINPWLLEHSDLCPICKRSILHPPA